MSKFLVTGGAGFIGSHIVDKLISLGHEVVVIDDFSSGKEENLIKHKNLTIYRRSICDDLDEIFEKEKIKAVFHLAALPGVQCSIKNPVQTHDVNVNGTLNLLNACKKFGVKRIVFSSSCVIYGNQEKLPFTEEMAPNPLCPYALHKLFGEHYCRLFNQLYGLEAISLRYFNVFGPRQNTEGDYAALIPKFIKLIDQGVKPVIFGDGEQTRDFVFVSDVVEANMLAANTKNKECFGRIINIGSGKNISVNFVTKNILKLSNKKFEPVHGKPVVELKHALADISKAKEMLGWSPMISFEQGLKETYDFFKTK